MTEVMVRFSEAKFYGYSHVWGMSISRQVKTRAHRLWLMKRKNDVKRPTEMMHKEYIWKIKSLPKNASVLDNPISKQVSIIVNNRHKCLWIKDVKTYSLV